MPKQKPAPRLEPTPLDAWDLPEDTTTLPLSTGRVVEVRPVDLTGLVLSGMAPNQILDWVVFRSLGKDAAKQTYGQHVKTVYEAKLIVCHHGMVTPKLALGVRGDLRDATPDKRKGEIAPRQLKPWEIDEIYAYLTEGVLPDVATAPFPAADDDGGEPGADAQPVSDVSPDAQPVSAVAE